jgi:hypothetical protein
MDSLFTIYKSAAFILSTFKDSELPFNMDTNKEVISRLKFISRINKGEKINIRNAYPFVQQDDLPTKISRTFYNKDNRGNALNFVRSTVMRSFEIVSTYRNSERQSDRVTCRHIIADLRRAKEGINNLKQTYIADTMFCCEMDTILQGIDAQLAELDDDEKKESDEEMP